MSAEHPVGTVARVRVGEWEGRALRLSTDVWALASTIGVRDLFADHEVAVLAVELTAPVAEPKSFGARVEFGPEGERGEAVLITPGEDAPWFTQGRGRYAWHHFINPVVLHDPEAAR